MPHLSIEDCKRDPARALRVLLRYLPLSLCVREIMRLRALSERGELETPLLDVGCGDGLFWEAAGETARTDGERLRGLMGIDVNPHELRIASLRLGREGGAVRRVDISGPHGTMDDIASATYPTILANCSLEHVRQIDRAFRNLHGLQRESGLFHLFVPAPDWTDTLRLKRLLSGMHPRLGMLYGAMWDGFFQHHHLYPHYVWRHLLESSGYHVETLQGIGSFHANRLFARWAAPSFPAFLYKELFKRYPTWYAPLKRGYVRWMEQGFLEEIRAGACIQSDPEHPETVEYYIVCRKKSGNGHHPEKP